MNNLEALHRQALADQQFQHLLLACGFGQLFMGMDPDTGTTITARQWRGLTLILKIDPPPTFFRGPESST